MALHANVAVDKPQSYEIQILNTEITLLCRGS